MGKKRVNPNRRPVTQADVIRARTEGVAFGVKKAYSMALNVLRDKEGFSLEDLQRFAAEMNYLADSIENNYVSVKDLENTLLDEESIRIKG